MGKVLVISRKSAVINGLSKYLSSVDCKAIICKSQTAALKIAEQEPLDVVVLDGDLDNGKLDLLPDLKELPSSPEVIVIVSLPSTESAEFAICNGAWDYLGLDRMEDILAAIDQALQYREEQMADVPPVALKREKIIGNSPVMRNCLKLLGQAAASDVNVLIVGETGTGKELFARAIHSNSPRVRNGILKRSAKSNYPRSDKNFVVVDCAALPETLVESVLFGHVRGAFTSAGSDHEGLVAQADGGTLFLDEVGELPLSTQKAFLRVLQEKKFRPVGGKTEKASSFRLIAATNQDLESLAEKGLFRKDLLFRLRGMTIELPPLRQRPEDIKDLVRYHTRRLCESYAMATKGLSNELLDMLKAHTWPGNVRELVNTIDGMLAVAGNAVTLYPKHLPAHLRVKLIRKRIDKTWQPKGQERLANLPRFREYRAAAEKRYLEDLLALTGRNMTRAARISGISRSRLYELVAKHKINPSPA